MNLAYFPQPDPGVALQAGWAMPSSGFGENLEAQWDNARTPDHGAIYDERARTFYDQAIAKLRAYGYGDDLPNPYLMVAPDYEHALIGGEGNPAMVAAVRQAAPKDYQPGGPFNPFALQDAWRAKLDRILIAARQTHPDIPDPTVFDQAIAAESAATRARAEDVASRATFMGHVGGIVGGAAGTQSRPDQMMMTAITLPIGGGAATLAETLIGRLLVTAGTDALLGAAQTGATDLAEAKFQQAHFGYSQSGADIARDMLYSAAGNALFGVATQGLGEAGGYLLSRARGAFGLRSAVEQSQALYPALPKIGRDAVEVLENQLQVATTGPAESLVAHAGNVAQAAEAVVQGKAPSVPNATTKAAGTIETTAGGHALETREELVEPVLEKELMRPGSQPGDMDAGLHAGRDADLEDIAAAEALPHEEIWRPGEPWPADILKAQREEMEIPTTIGINTAERNRLRAEIAGKLYGTGAAVKDRQAVIVLGPPAAGKSTIADPLAREYQALTIDSDMAKVKLPEYRGGIGATAVHDESDLIAGMIYQRAIENGDNIVLPLVGRTLDKLRANIKLLKQAGYKVRLVLADLPIDKAVNRAILRFRADGRFVNPEYVLSVGDAPVRTYEALKKEVDSYGRYSTDVPRGEAARFVKEDD